MNISVIFPVYKKSRYLIKNVEKIEKIKNLEKEYIVFIDCPDKKFLKNLEKLSKTIKNLNVIVNNERCGKVFACNESARIAKGDILIFLDSDVLIKELDLNEIVEACKSYDIVDIPKEIMPKKLLGCAMAIEYIGYFISCKESSKIEKTIIFNGAGFAIKKDKFFKFGGFRRYVIEDVEFATRVSLNNGKYYLAKNSKLYVEPILSLSKWIDQRKRWAYGFVEWIVSYIRPLSKFFARHIRLLLKYLIILNPGFLLMFLLSLIPFNFWFKMAEESLILIATKISPIFLFILPIDAIIYFLKFLFLIGGSTTLLYIYYRHYAKRYEFQFKTSWFLIYYFAYAPLFTFITLGTFLFYLMFGRAPRFNWKV